MKISTNDSSSCRIVGIFKVSGKERYASIKVDSNANNPVQE